jgi:hypothetical protein
MSEHEHLEAGVHGHGEHAGGDKKVALLVTIMAALLAVTEISGKGAQTEALVANVNSNDLWAYYQAKSTRETFVSTLADTLDDLRTGVSPDLDTKLAARIDTLRSRAAHYESDPDKKDGKKEIQERAQEDEKERDHSLEKYRIFELASAAYELGIVLCSISMMLEVPLMVGAGAALGVLGLFLSAGGWFKPELLWFLP